MRSEASILVHRPQTRGEEGGQRGLDVTEAPGPDFPGGPSSGTWVKCKMVLSLHLLGQRIKVPVLGQQVPLRATPSPFGVFIKLRDTTSSRLLMSICWKNHCRKYKYQ